MLELTAIDKHLLNDFQKTFPLTPTPYRDLADRLGVDEKTVIDRLKILADKGLISRIGPIFTVNGIGISTLAAMAVPGPRLDEVADYINSFREVNHNYEREHEFNLWFVITAENESELNRVIKLIEDETGIEIMELPMLENYHVDLGFNLQWPA